MPSRACAGPLGRGPLERVSPGGADGSAQAFRPAASAGARADRAGGAGDGQGEPVVRGQADRGDVPARSEAQPVSSERDQPPLIVTDNGPSFTAKRLVRYTKQRFRHVRIAYRTPTQPGLLERCHRTLKQEEVYWRQYDSPSEARQCPAEFQERDNTRRPHWALRPEAGGDPLTPEDMYVQGQSVRLPAWQPWAKQEKQAKGQLDPMMRAEAA